MILIPEVRSLQSLPGAFLIDNTVSIIKQNTIDKSGFIAATIQEILATIGVTTPIAITASSDHSIILSDNAFIDHPEGYSLHISPSRIELSASTSAGLFYALQTFRQIVLQYGTTLPCVKISDQPFFLIRGFYHDVTRGKVPTIATLKLLAEKCARYKINQLQLYIEHTFAFSFMPELWADKDPLTANEIRELDAFCRERHIDLVPSMACFGHLYELLRLPRFEHLNELDIKASSIPFCLFDRMLHYTLDVSQPQSFLLVKEMFDEFLPLFSSQYCNICCDETMDLGKGKNLDRAEKEGTGRLYVEFLNKIMAIVKGHGKQPMFWGDIILHSPELIGDLPKDAIFLNWWYTADVTDDSARKFAQAGVTQIVCPGVNAWSRFSADVKTACTNIRKQTSYAAANGAIGILNTDWGDCGHINLLAHSFHGLIFGAALSWNQTSFIDDGAFDSAVSLIEWHDATGTTAGLLRQLGNYNPYQFKNLYGWIKNLIIGRWNIESQIPGFDPDDLIRQHAELLRIKASFVMLRSDCAKDKRQDYDEFIWACSANIWAIELLVFKQSTEFFMSCTPLATQQSIFENGSVLLDDFKKLWRKRNKESELRVIEWIFRSIFEKTASLA